MSNETLKQLLTTKQTLDFQTLDQDFEKVLRLTVRDRETGELGVLIVEPCQLVLPDEVALDYEYRVISDRLAPSPEHFYNIATRVGPDYDASDVPFLQGEQGGLF